MTNKLEDKPDDVTVTNACQMHNFDCQEVSVKIW